MAFSMVKSIGFSVPAMSGSFAFNAANAANAARKTSSATKTSRQRCLKNALNSSRLVPTTYVQPTSAIATRIDHQIAPIDGAIPMRLTNQTADPIAKSPSGLANAAPRSCRLPNASHANGMAASQIA